MVVINMDDKKEDKKEEKEKPEVEIEVNKKKVSKKVSKPMNKTYLFTGAVIISFVLGYIISGIPLGGLDDGAIDDALEYIQSNIPSSITAMVIASEKNDCLYEMNVSLSDGNNTQYLTSYVSQDGGLLFPSAIDLNEVPLVPPTTNNQEPETMTCEDIPKSDSPTLQAFVVSYCPFGLQMQRILADVVPALGTDNIEVLYMGQVVDGEVQAMHGEEEAQENLRQICIREEQSEKFWDYLSCFMEEGKVEECLEEVEIDVDSLDACMEGDGVGYAEEDFALARQYGVTGSPTLIMGGERVSEFDFGGRTAEAVKILICCGFNSPPDACDQELSSTSAARGFAPAGSTGSETGSATCG
jgi:hypothetical protein